MNSNIFSRWIVKGSIFIFIILTAFIFLLNVFPQNQRHFLQVIYLKHRLLESTSSPRIIMVGGSNVFLGIDCVKMTEILKIPVINDGLAVGLGLRFILNDLKPFIRKNDIIVLSPEYNHFLNEKLEGGNIVYTAGIFDTYPQAVRNIEPAHYSKLLDIYIALLRYRFQNFIDIKVLKRSDERKINLDRVYSPCGDYISHLEKLSKADIDNYAYIHTNDRLNSNAIKYLNNFYKKAASCGAAVVMVYPPSRMTNVTASGGRLMKLDRDIRNLLDFPIISHPADSYYSDELFYDSRYHLNREGRQLHTSKLTEILINNGVVKLNH